MREHLYRVWRGDRYEYDVVVGKFGVFYVNPEADGTGLDPEDRASLTPGTTKIEDCDVEDFIGAYDKHDNPIYEGDILDDGSRFPFLVVWRLEGWFGEWRQPDTKTFDENGECNDFYIESDRLWDMLNDDTEIIGNINANRNLIYGDDG